MAEWSDNGPTGPDKAALRAEVEVLRVELEQLRQRLTRLERRLADADEGVRPASRDDQPIAPSTPPQTVPLNLGLPAGASVPGNKEAPPARQPADGDRAREQPFRDTSEPPPVTEPISRASVGANTVLRSGFTLPPELSRFIQRYVVGGNHLVKVGVLVLFLGLAFALRYAASSGLFPLWARYLAVASVGVAMLVQGWRLRGRADHFGLVIQGGGIGICYLTTLAAMKLQPLLPPAAGFVLLALIAALAAILAVVYLMGWFWFSNTASSGGPLPYPFVPFVNPLGLGLGAVLIVLAGWWLKVSVNSGMSGMGRSSVALFAGSAFVLLTGEVLRACHHWAGVPWTLEALSASYTVQTSLSVVWGIAAISLMLLGNRRQRRETWISGALLMTAVVIKLFAVELAASGSLQRIVSFIGVGFMLLLVGYLAPLPPRPESDIDGASTE